MAEFSKLVITKKGQALIAKMLAGQGDIEFSKISASNAFYEVDQLDALEELPDVKQTNKISKITRTNEVAVRVETAFSNTELTEGYYMRTLGLYAIDPDDGEILYAATTETTGNCYMPAYNGVTVSGAYVQLVSTVGNAENVAIKIDQAAIATIGNIQDLQDQINKMLGNNPDGGGLEFAKGIKADNMVGAINEVFTLGSEKKGKLAENLTAMGIESSADETWESLLNKVLDMTDTSGDTVTAPVLLMGYTAHDASGEQISGNMPEMAAVTVEAVSTTQDSEYTYMEMPEGHYDAASKVRTKNSNLQNRKIALGSGRSIDIKQYTDNWAKLTKDNFAVEIVGFAFTGSTRSNSGGHDPGTVTAVDNLIQNGSCSYSYNAETGILSIAVANVRWQVEMNLAFDSNTRNGSVAFTTSAYLFL